MSELHRFVFEGMPVRGALVRLTDAWREVLSRRAANSEHGAHPQAVAQLLGEMLAAGVLMQSNIKFEGALVLQIFGDGPVKLAVAEVKADLSFRATASVVGQVAPDASFESMVNHALHGRCAITLDPTHKFPGQQPYQGVVPLVNADGHAILGISEAITHYMVQSEQLPTVLVLAADAHVAAGLLIQRMPVLGANNLAGQRHRAATAAVIKTDGGNDMSGDMGGDMGGDMHGDVNGDGSDAGSIRGRASAGDADVDVDADEDYHRIATLAASLKRGELLGLDAQAVLHRLFWEEPLAILVPEAAAAVVPRFACVCSRGRVQRMIVGLGLDEAQSILSEQGQVEVACEFCAAQYRFDAVDVTQLFAAPGAVAPPTPGALQ